MYKAHLVLLESWICFWSKLGQGTFSRSEGMISTKSGLKPITYLPSDVSNSIHQVNSFSQSFNGPFFSSSGTGGGMLSPTASCISSCMMELISDSTFCQDVLGRAPCSLWTRLPTLWSYLLEIEGQDRQDARGALLILKLNSVSSWHLHSSMHVDDVAVAIAHACICVHAWIQKVFCGGVKKMRSALQNEIGMVIRTETLFDVA